MLEGEDVDGLYRLLAERIDTLRPEQRIVFLAKLAFAALREGDRRQADRLVELAARDL